MEDQKEKERFRKTSFRVLNRETTLGLPRREKDRWMRTQLSSG